MEIAAGRYKKYNKHPSGGIFTEHGKRNVMNIVHTVIARHYFTEV
jgi:hypothetical protein